MSTRPPASAAIRCALSRLMTCLRYGAPGKFLRYVALANASLSTRRETEHRFQRPKGCDDRAVPAYSSTTCSFDRRLMGGVLVVYSSYETDWNGYLDQGAAQRSDGPRTVQAEPFDRVAGAVPADAGTHPGLEHERRLNPRRPGLRIL